MGHYRSKVVFRQQSSKALQIVRVHCLGFRPSRVPAEEGTEYRLAELKAPSGYVTAKGQWKVTYEKETHELKITGSVKRPPAFSGEGTDENPYKVINYTYAEFPLSGGRGYSYLAGTVLIAAAAGLWFWYDSRKRKTVRSRGMRKRGYK